MATLDASPLAAIFLVNDLRFATIVAASATSVTFETASVRLVVKETGLTTALDGGELELTGGSITGIDGFVLEAGAWIPAFSMGSLSLTAERLNMSIDREQSGSDVESIENLFLGFGYVVIGTVTDGTIPPLQTPEGTDLVLRGTNRWYLGAENDVVFGGAGSNTMYNGAGRDTLRGGDLADTILGGADNDTL